MNFRFLGISYCSSSQNRMRLGKISARLRMCTSHTCIEFSLKSNPYKTIPEMEDQKQEPLVCHWKYLYPWVILQTIWTRQRCQPNGFHDCVDTWTVNWKFRRIISKLWTKILRFWHKLRRSTRVACIIEILKQNRNPSYRFIKVSKEARTQPSTETLMATVFRYEAWGVSFSFHVSSNFSIREAWQSAAVYEAAKMRPSCSFVRLLTL